MRKNTKHTLVFSLISLLMCFTMLIATTFAWFTDAASSSVNTIQSGNLDITLEYKTKLTDEWADVTKTTQLFNKDALYEPGYTEVVFLRVANAGNLALKYKLSLNVEDTVIGKTASGADIRLSEYLQIGWYQQDEYHDGFNYWDILGPSMFNTREKALDNVTDMVMLKDLDVVVDAPMTAEEQTSSIIVLVLHMPATVGNEANHNGVDVPEVTIGVDLLATQLASESDSFGNDYDADAEYPVLVEPYPTASEGLYFTLNDTGNGYVLSGIGSCYDLDLVIPQTHDGVNGELPVTEIKAEVFSQLPARIDDITSITLPASVKTINASAFSGMESLQTVKFTADSRLETIDSSAFYACPALKSVTVPAGVTEIGSYAFSQCTSLKSVTFASNSKLTTIGASAFSGSALEGSVTIPASVETLGNNAFAFNTSLASVEFAEGTQIKTIGSFAFYKCTGLKTIMYNGTQDEWNTVTKGSDWKDSTAEMVITG